MTDYSGRPKRATTADMIDWRATCKDRDIEIARLRGRIADLESWQSRACYVLGHAYPRLKGKHTDAAIELVNEIANERWREGVTKDRQ